MSNYDFTSLEEVHSRAPMPSPCPLCAAKNQMIRLEAENAALRKAIAAVESEANSHEQLASEFASNEGERVIHRLAARGLRVALTLAETDERKADTE